MSELCRIVARVKSIEGTCALGHSVGDEIVPDGKTVRGRVCLHALYSILPKVSAMRYGAHYPLLDRGRRDVATRACPDPQNPAVVEVRRAPEERG